MPRTYFSPDVKREAVDLVLHSQFSVAGAAQQVGCSVNALHHWLKKHRQQQAAAESPTFVPVNIIDAPHSPVEIVVPNGITIRLADASPKSIAELLHALVLC